MKIDRLEKLINIFSVASYEEKLKKFFKAECFEKEFIEDNLGSVFYLKKTNKKDAKRLLIACSMDELGLMIKEPLKDGSFSFITLEKLSPASLLHQRVNILTRDDEIIEGIITYPKVKFNEVALDRIDIDDLTIDLLDSNYLSKIKPGDLCTFKGEISLSNERIIAKALNQKVFIEIIISLIEKLKNYNLDYDLALGIIAQSTIGFRGSKTANYVVKPDFAIILNGFEVNNSDPKINLGDGIIVSQFDKQMIPNKLFLNDFKSYYDTKDYFGIIGNDGSFIHKTLNGVRCISIGIPIKNIYSPVEMLNLNDAVKLEKALLNYLINLNDEKLNNLEVIK